MPVVQVVPHNRKVAPGQGIPAYSLFSTTIPDDDLPNEYEVWDAPGVGYIRIAGSPAPSGVGLLATSATLLDFQYVGGAAAGADTVWVRAHNGSGWSAWASVLVVTQSTPNALPAVAVFDRNIDRNQWRLLTELVAGSDADGDTIRGYEIRDLNAAADTGYLWANGAALPQGGSANVSSLNDTWVRGGAVAGGDTYEARAFDGFEWGAWTPFTLTTRAVANRAPVADARNNAVAVGQTVAAGSLFNITDADGDPPWSYELWDGGAGGGKFRISGVDQGAGVAIAVSAAQLAGTVYAAGAAPGSETLWVRAYDGQAWSVWEDWTMFSHNRAGNSAPVAVAVNRNIDRNQWRLLTELVAVSDAEGDPINQFQVRDATAAADSGYLWAEGVSYGQGATVTVASLADTWVRGGAVAGGDTYEARAFDGFEWGAWTSFALTTRAVANRAPVVSAADRTLRPGQAVGVAAMFSVTDADGDAAFSYELWDGGAGGGYFRINGGSPRPAGMAVPVASAQLALSEYVGGPTQGTETLWVRANDGQAWGAWAPWQATTVNGLPVASSVDLTLFRSETRSASSLFSVVDPDGDAISRYRFWDGGTGGGYFSLNGAPQPANQSIEVTAAQLAQVTYVAGATPSAEQLWVQPFDGYEWGPWESWLASAINRAPSVIASPASVPWGQSLLAASVFSVSDADGDATGAYEFWDSAGGGFFAIGGVGQPADQAIPVSPSQLANMAYVGGFSAGAETVWVRAYDGYAWGAWEAWVMTTVGNAPVVSAGDAKIGTNKSVAAGSLFTATDPDGDAITQYQLWDSAGGGYFALNGVAQPAGASITVTASALATATYVGGAEVGAETVWARANDGSGWSPWRAWTMDTVYRFDERPGTTFADSVQVNAHDAIYFGFQGNDSITTRFDYEPFLMGGEGADVYMTPGGTGEGVVGILENGNSAGDQLWVGIPLSTLSVATIDGRHLLLLDGSTTSEAVVLFDWQAPANRIETFFVPGLGPPISYDQMVAVVASSGAPNLTWEAVGFSARHVDEALAYYAQREAQLAANDPPSVQFAGVVLKYGQSVPVAPLITATDPDGDAVVSYEFTDNDAAALTGYFTLGAAVQPGGVPFVVTAGQLSQLSWVAGSGGALGASNGTETFTIRVADALEYGPPTNAHLSFYDNRAPQLFFPGGGTGGGVSLRPGEAIALGALFQAGDPDGDPVAEYRFFSFGNWPGESLQINGVAQPFGQWIRVPADQLATVWYVAPSVMAGLSNVSVAVYDADGAGSESSILVEMRPTGGRAPEVKASMRALAPGASRPVTDFFVASDPEGDLLQFTFEWVRAPGVDDPAFTLNGIPQNGPFTVGSAGLGQVRVVGGAAGSGNSFIVSVSDGDARTYAASASVVTTSDRPPAVTAADRTLALDAITPLGSLFSASDPDGDPISSYSFREFGQTSPTGKITLGNASFPAGVYPSDLPTMRYFSSGAASVETLEITAESSGSGVSLRSDAVRVSVTSGSLPSDTVGNTLATARALAVGAATQTITDFVTDADPHDYFRLNLADAGELRLSLQGLGGNADLTLLDGAGAVLANSSTMDSWGESIAFAAGTGTYYAHVFARDGESTQYTFGASLA